eukprot:5215158-Amphidinium_carterae.1
MGTCRDLLARYTWIVCWRAAGPTMADRQARYIQIAGTDSSGEHVSVQLKAHIYTDGSTYVELYNPLQHLLAWKQPKIARMLE